MGVQDDPREAMQRAALEEAGRAAANAVIRGKNAMPTSIAESKDGQGQTYESVTTLFGGSQLFDPEPEPGVHHNLASGGMDSSQRVHGPSLVGGGSLRVPMVIMSSTPVSESSRLASLNNSRVLELPAET